LGTPRRRPAEPGKPRDRTEKLILFDVFWFATGGISTNTLLYKVFVFYDSTITRRPLSLNE